jgi:GTPase SAR1 family protein
MYYRDADAAILMFDMSDSSTLKDIIDYWLPSVTDYGPQNIVLALVGNKAKIVSSSGDEKSTNVSI